MHWLLFVLALAFIPLLALFAWLGFNLILVKWHGLRALDKTPQIYRPFRPQEWTVRRLPVDPAQPPADPQATNGLPPAV
ncbi:hypothetical protein QLQ12_40600 [Actinoplanes sp. NEAU-A12]|uniref:Uncharacterized protein n=1 Tax=Actinoplanes sandaracinus TaxID=3045177 RepID=A0ABT6WYS7_9ACTN|nr:hypothetical protein [Actinoplanes sandaracinus]MDI6104905.1 hypothetical protein [Actinoplanes sandaracinus]